MAVEVPTATLEKCSVLTPDDINQWMKYGYVVIKNAFTKEQAEEQMKDIWTRLGYDPNDKSTWAMDRVNMPGHKYTPCSTFAPKVWQAICDLTGGAERIDENNLPSFGDGFICNFGKDEYVGKDFSPKELDNWHVDGDFFTHYLDSPEQGMLMIPMYTDIKPGGGGTIICPDGMEIIAKHLAAHPEGVTPRMVPRGQSSNHKDLEWFIEKVQQFPDEAFHEMTGNTGDVVLMHPLMLHSASKNTLRLPRVITNPTFRMKDPFRFSRNHTEEYSLIELKTLSLLGVDRFDYNITGNREYLNPTRIEIHARMREEEKLRLAGQLHRGNMEKGYDINRLEGEVF